MRNILTQKQENFCLRLSEGLSQREAYLAAGYSPKQSPETLDRHASALAKNDKILTRWEELRKKAEDDSVAKGLERRQVLTQIMRARQTNYMTCSADGVWMHDIGEETLNSAALKKIRTTTMPFGDKDSNLKIILTEVELRDPMVAIDLLNKMDKLYSEGAVVNIDNRKIEIIVATPTAKKLLTEIVEGEAPHAPDND